MIKFKNKSVFLDIDGTLAEYRFSNHVSVNDGTINGQSQEEIDNGIFLHSRPLKTMQKLTKKLKRNNCQFYILGGTISPKECSDKLKWLDKFYGHIKFVKYFWIVPDDYWHDFLSYFYSDTSVYSNYAVDEDDNCVFIRGSKTDYWNWHIEHKISSIEDTVYIDDVLPFVKFAESIGIDSYHNSSFIK